MDVDDDTPRKRNRRPPKQFSGTISWEQAEKIVKNDERKAKKSNGQRRVIPESMNFEEEQGDAVDDDNNDDDDSDDDMAFNLEDPQDLSMDDWQEGDGNTSDEFIPDLEKKHSDRHKTQEDDFGSDSGEEFASSEENETDTQLIPDVETPQRQINDLLTTTQRLDRAKKRRWHPPTGHGGMENPEAWKEAGEKSRQMQIKAREAEKDKDVQIEVADDELQTLADAFAGDGADATVKQVERWQSALHMRDDDDDDEQGEEEEMDEAAFDQDIRGAIGFKRRTVRDKRTGAVSRPMREQNYSAPVRALLAEANFAYIESDLPRTIAKLQEVIKLEPAVRSAWGTLALCFEELKEPERALQSRIMEAHLTYRPIALWEGLARSSLKLGYNEQALYCLSKAISSSREKDRVDVIDIMWERGQLLEELNEPRRAMHSYLQMLHYRPQNQSIIRQLIPLLFQMNMLDRAIRILQQCEEWNMAAFPDPLLDPAMMDEDLGPDVRNTYEPNEVVTLADLLLRANRPQEALHTIRRGARWLDGRGSEEFWNEVGDDREFDESREDGDREGNYGRRVEMAAIHYLEPELRFQLAVARARMGDAEEAERHFNIWQRDAHMSDQLEHYSDMAEEYARLGAMLEEEERESSRWYTLALDYTSQTIQERQKMPDYGDDGEAIIADYKRTAACHIGLGESQQAIAWLVEVIEYNPDDFESKLRLAEAYEETGDRQTAINLVTEVVRSKRERQLQQGQRQGTEPLNDETLAQSLSFFAEIQKKNSRDGGEGASKQTIRDQRKELEKIREMESNMAWKQLKQREEKVFINRWWSADIDMSGDPRKRQYGDHESSRAKEERFGHVAEWLSDAERLVTMFQNTPQLYPRDKTKKFSGVLRTKRKKADMVESQATAILARLGDDMLDDRDPKGRFESSSFRGVKLDDWVHLIMQYAFVLTKVGEYGTAAKVIRHVIRSNVIWSDEKRKASLKMCLASCALYSSDYVTMVAQLKSLTSDYMFHNEPLRVLQTLANATGYSTLGVYSQPNNLKTFLRRSRIHEAMVQGNSVSYNSTTGRWVVDDKLFQSTTRDSDNEDNGEEDEEVERSSGNNKDDKIITDEQDDQDEEVNTLQQDTSFNKVIMTKGRAQDLWKDLQHDPKIDAIKLTPPTKYNPANDMFYAGLLLASNTGVPSMGYWIRVFARQQTDPLICLTAAVACFGRAQNRQVDNRHQVIIQAFAFLHHYRQLRRQQVPLDQSKSEVSYNFGRAFHRLGLYQLAVPHYKEVLEIKYDKSKSSVKGLITSTTKTNKQSGFTAWPEAAYNLSLVYLASGNPILANHIVEQHLRL